MLRSNIRLGEFGSNLRFASMNTRILKKVSQVVLTVEGEAGK